MPWARIYLLHPVEAAQQEVIQREVGRILLEEMKKEVTKLLVTFHPILGLYRGGIPSEDAAGIELGYVGRFGLTEKQSVTRRICHYMGECLGLDPQKIYVVFQEVESANWGRREGNYS